MPTVKDGESEKDFVERCIPMVISEGTAKDGEQGAAICHSMFKKHMEKKSVDASFSEQERAIRDAFTAAFPSPMAKPEMAMPSDCWVREVYADHVIVEQVGETYQVNYALDADGKPAFDSQDKWVKVEQAYVPAKTVDDVMVAVGGGIKSLGNGKYGGTLIRFTAKGDYDKTGDRFDAKTDYGFRTGETKQVHVFFHHAQPLETKAGKLYIENEIGTGELTMTEKAINIIAQARKEYDAMFAGAMKDLSWSSGTASHLIIREKEGKGNYIKRWLLGDDASITPQPAENRNAVYAMKSLPKVDFALPKGDAEGTANPAAQGGAKEKVNIGGKDMELEVEIKAIQAKLEEQEKEPLTVEQRKALKGILDRFTALDTEHQAMKKALEAEKPAGSGARVIDNSPMAAYKSINARAPFGVFLNDVRNQAMGQNVSSAFKAILGSNESVPSEGGFLVPTEVESAIDKKMFDSSVLASRCDTKILTVGNSADFFGRDEDSRANGSRYGGVTAYRVAEGNTITASGALKHYKYTLKPKEYAALYIATNDVLQDAALLEAEIMDAVPSELAFLIDDDIFEGLGVAGCLGLTKSAAYVTITRKTTSHVNYEDVVGVYARVWARSWQNVVWLYNQDILPDLLTMTLGVGVGGLPVYLPPGAASAAPYGTLLGRPMQPFESCSSLGTVGDLVAVDMTQYKLATKGDLQTAQSMHVYFDTNQMAYRFIKRVDGQSKWKNALTPFKGTGNTQSPFVAIAT